MRTTRGVCWPAGEEARVRVGPVTACARDEARLGWSPRGGTLLDRIDLVEKMRRRRRRLGGYWIRLEKKAAETKRKRTKGEGRGL